MKILFKRMILILVFTTILLNSNLFSQREIILKRSIDVSLTSPDYFINTCDYSLLIPANKVGKQQILDYKYSIKPERALKTEAEEYYLQWKKISFGEVKKAKLEVTMKIRLNVYDLKTAKKHPLIDKNELDTLPYLKDEENFRANSKSIAKVSETITGENREEIVKNIFNYVIGNMEYFIFLEQDRGAKKALKDGKGDCTEYSELMVTLCRSKKIPARIVMGVIPKSNHTVGYHNWVEVFFPEYGWVSFDPTWADHATSATTFYTMRNAYVQTGYKRFINNIYCSCDRITIPYTYKLNDSCADLSSNINIRFNNMMSYYNSNKWDEAKVLLDSLLKEEPDNFSYWIFDGNISVKKGSYDSAFQSYQNAISYSESVSQKYTCLYYMAKLFALKDDKDGAVKYLQEAFNYGLSNYHNIESDPCFKNMVEYQPLTDIINKMKRQNPK
jgi:tetratricopeptide (TPR) repeat protein